MKIDNLFNTGKMFYCDSGVKLYLNNKKKSVSQESMPRENEN